MKRKGYFIRGEGISLRREGISLCGVGISQGLYGISAGRIREISVFSRVPTKKKCAVKNPKWTSILLRTLSTGVRLHEWRVANRYWLTWESDDVISGSKAHHAPVQL